MTTRTTQGTVRFTSAFSLPGFDLPLPAGEYRVDRDDEPIQTEAHLGWVRVATFIHLPAISTRGSMQQMVPVDPAFLEAALEKDREAIVTASMQRSGRRNRPDEPVHRFEVGQAVRLKGSFVKFSPDSSNVYRITGRLPPRENSPQYRIRNEGERHERVTTQDSIEAIDISPAGDGATLIERTFGHGQGTETQQSRDPKAQAGQGAA